MAIIPLPVTTRFARKIEWNFDRPAQVNRSAYGGGRSVVANPWQGRWSAKVDLLPILGEAAVRPWRVFLALLKGPINNFRLPATEGPQAVYGAQTWGSGAGAGATSILINNTETGLAPSGLKAGMFVTISDQLLLMTADETPSGGGQSTIVFEPPLRAAVAANVVIETKNPTCLVALTGPSISWGVEPGKIYAVGSLAVEESW